MDAVIPARPDNQAAPWLARLHGFLDWWGQGLRWVLPLRLRQRWFPVADCVWLQLDGAEAAAWVAARDEGGVASPSPSTRSDSERVLAQHADLPRWLLLPPALVVRAQLDFPQAGIDHMQQAMRYEIDRQTPFAAHEVAFDAHVLSVDNQAKTVLAELVAAPLMRLEPLLVRAQGLGIQLQGIDVADAEGVPAGVNLLPVERRMKPLNRWRRRNLILAAAAMLLLMLGGLISIQRETARADALEAELARDRIEARRIGDQRQRLMALTEGARQVQAIRDLRVPLTLLLNGLAERLPGNTWVERLSVQGEQMQLSGLSPQSTRLVPALQASPLWRDVAMSGAVAADGGNGGERFTLGMRLNPPGSTGAKR